MGNFSFFQMIDVLGTAAFAISGARHAMDRKLDVFGVIIIAFVTAIGGGTIRDVIIGSTPVGWLQNELTITVILIAAIGTLIIDGNHPVVPNTLFLFDSLGLGLFTLAGIDKALQYDFSVGICIALGTISACFGGVLRDVLLNKVPLIFHRELYASACIAGGVLFFLLRYLHVDGYLNQILCILLIFVVRILAVRYNLTLPAAQTDKKKLDRQ